VRGSSTRVVLATLLVASLTACSLLIDTSDLDRGDIADGGAEDAPTREGAADAANDVATGPFCASLSPKPTVCLDFDEASSVVTYFNGSFADGDGGAVTVDTSAFQSPPASLLVTAPTSHPPGFYGIGVERLVDAVPTTTAHLAFDLRLDKASPVGQTARYATIHLLTPGGHYYLYLNAGAGGCSFASDFYATDGGIEQLKGPPMLPCPEPGVWTHVEWTVTVNPPEERVSFNGVDADKWTIPAERIGKASFFLGINYLSNEAPNIQHRFDSVVFDVK
jgi:hypothetical protein